MCYKSLGISPWKGKKLLTYGDSLTAFGGWQDQVKNVMELKSYVNLGHNGSSVATPPPHSYYFPSPFCEPDRIYKIKKADPDVITLFGGANDILLRQWLAVKIGTSAELSKDISLKDTYTFYGAYSYLIETLLKWKPTLKILIIVQYPFYKFIEENFESYFDYVEQTAIIRQATKEIADYYGLPYVDFGDMEIITYDGLHFNGTPMIQYFSRLVIKGLNNMVNKY
jgi:lysophospholipase L1-like esterase